MFIVVILSRRLGWCILQELQSHWPKFKATSSPASSPPTPTTNRSARSGQFHIGKSSKVKSEGAKRKESQLTLTHLLVALCALLVIVWSVVRLVQHTSLYNLLFLFYPYVCYHPVIIKSKQLFSGKGGTPLCRYPLEL